MDGLKKSKKSSSKIEKVKRISFKKLVIFVVLLCLAFFELGIGLGLGFQISDSGSDQERYLKKLSEHENVLPFIKIAKAEKEEKIFFGAEKKIPENFQEKSFNVPILMYHHIKTDINWKDPFDYGLTVSPANFEAQVKYLSDNGYNTITFDDLCKAFYENGILPSKPVILTFDDGYRDNYDHAFQILKKYGKKGTFFMISGLIDSPVYMTKGQLKEMSDAGMEIGAHTTTHVNLKSIGLEKIILEMALSKKEIERVTGRLVGTIAYPYGDYDQRAVNVAKSQGYFAAVTTQNGKVHSNKKPFEMARLRVGPGTTIRSFALMVAP